MEQRIIRYCRTPPDAMRLLCLPHAGGGAATFFPWSQQLQPEIDVCAVVAPGRDHRRNGEPSFDTVAALAEHLAESVRSVVDRPFALFGHSLGAALAYEIARRLEDDGCRPAQVFVAARGAPNTTPIGPPLSGLDDDAFVTRLQERYEAIPASILADPELLGLFLPTLRADLRLHEEYSAPCVPLSCPITALGGRDDRVVRISDLDAWAAFTHSRFERHLVSGGHFFLRDARAETLAVIARTLRTELVMDPQSDRSARAVREPVRTHRHPIDDDEIERRLERQERRPS